MKLKRLQHEIDALWGSAAYKPGVQHADHAVLHLMKALGKIATMIEQTHHIDGDDPDVRNQVADLVICSARLASLLHLDLQVVVENRLAEKFPSPKNSLEK